MAFTHSTKNTLCILKMNKMNERRHSFIYILENEKTNREKNVADTVTDTHSDIGVVSFSLLVFSLII